MNYYIIEKTSYNNWIIPMITLILGIFIFILERFVEKLFIDPIVNQKKIIEDISVALINYSRFYTNPIQKFVISETELHNPYNKASDEIRSLASLLKTSKTSIKYYTFWVKLKLVPEEKIIDDAFTELIRLSNSFFSAGKAIENDNIANKIRKLLNLPNLNN